MPVNPTKQPRESLAEILARHCTEILGGLEGPSAAVLDPRTSGGLLACFGHLATRASTPLAPSSGMELEPPVAEICRRLIAYFGVDPRLRGALLLGGLKWLVDHYGEGVAAAAEALSENEVRVLELDDEVPSARDAVQYAIIALGLVGVAVPDDSLDDLRRWDAELRRVLPGVILQLRAQGWSQKWRAATHPPWMWRRVLAEKFDPS